MSVTQDHTGGHPERVIDRNRSRGGPNAANGKAVTAHKQPVICEHGPAVPTGRVTGGRVEERSKKVRTFRRHAARQSAFPLMEIARRRNDISSYCFGLGKLKPRYVLPLIPISTSRLLGMSGRRIVSMSSITYMAITISVQMAI